MTAEQIAKLRLDGSTRTATRANATRSKRSYERSTALHRARTTSETPVSERHRRGVTCKGYTDVPRPEEAVLPSTRTQPRTARLDVRDLEALAARAAERKSTVSAEIAKAVSAAVRDRPASDEGKPE